MPNIKDHLTIIVLDYRHCSCKKYNVEVTGFHNVDFDAESWLNEHTDYNSDCYYMCIYNDELTVEEVNVSVDKDGKTVFNNKRPAEIEQ